jgi:hypothetical protein
MSAQLSQVSSRARYARRARKNAIAPKASTAIAAATTVSCALLPPLDAGAGVT